MKENKEQLLPCPFCGRDVGLKIMKENEEGKNFIVSCLSAKCTAHTPVDTIGFADEYTAIKAWNTRVKPAMKWPKEKSCSWCLDDPLLSCCENCASFNEAIRKCKELNGEG